MLTKSLPLLFLPLIGLLVGPFACQNSNATAQSEVNNTPVYEDLDAAAFAAKLKEGGDIVLLDVRSAEETTQGKIEGATELDYYGDDFAAQLAALDKDKTYLVYCASGNRSGKTCKMLQEQGFKACYNLAGGYGAWQKLK